MIMQKYVFKCKFYIFLHLKFKFYIKYSLKKSNSFINKI